MGEGLLYSKSSGGLIYYGEGLLYDRKVVSAHFVVLRKSS